MHAVAGLLLSAAASVAASVAAPDVPLALWTSASYPNGLDLGGTVGVSFGDYDGDGFVDIFAGWSGNLWRNEFGAGWAPAVNLQNLMPLTQLRYGSSFGDFDNDGLPDIAIAPRVAALGDDRLHLLHNLGGGNFADVAGDPSVVDVQPHGNAETLCWADVNGDGNLDLFVPVYPAWEGGPGNFFLLNQGPTGVQGAYQFIESSGPAGLDNPPGSSRPEGAQFVDVDGDGDVDLYAGGTLFQNVSTATATRFHPLDSLASGIGLPASLDEGAMFFDYDLDGDFDLVVAYSNEGVRIWENRGDGTFFAAESGIVDEPMTGLNLGMSAEDWDNDGDVDFTTRGVFRRNMMIEEGRRHFAVASTSIRSADLTSATPAWGDWDKDGDLDCALGNWGSDGWLYENTMYASTTAPSAKRYMRVRVARDSRTVARGLETEYGAAVELRVLGGSDPFRHRKFVASSHGYLNQNEYTLHFGLPDAARVHVSVDFPVLAAGNTWRVDKRVNPVLGDIDPAALIDREITVTRCGEVVVDGIVHDPIPLMTPRLTSTTGGLALPAPGTVLADPTPAPHPDWYSGLAFDTLSATQQILVKEILLDGQLDAPVSCGAGDRNITLWDVTDASRPVSVAGGILAQTTSSRNRRSAFPVDIILPPGHSYRLVARVTEDRPTAIAAPITADGITVQGGLEFRDQTGCNGLRAANASADPTETALAIRFGPVPSNTDLDPVGASLRLSRDANDEPVLSWADVGAPGYQILRCSATAGACAPRTHADSAGPVYADPDVTPLPGESYWYVVKAVNACTAGL